MSFITDFINSIGEALQFDFILYALLVGSLIAICCSLLGIFLVLRKHSLIGDGLAHVSFATVAIAVLIGVFPMLVSIPLVIAASFIINALNKKADIHGDAAIGLISSVSVATGYMITSMARGYNIDLQSYLFGSILSITMRDIAVSVILSVIVITTIILFYNSLFAITFDEEFAKVRGLNTSFLNSLISVLTSVTIVLGIRVVGTLLISSMIIFPTVSALQLSASFRKTIVWSSVISVACVVAGVLLSYSFSLPTGSAIVILNALVFMSLFTVKKIRNR